MITLTIRETCDVCDKEVYVGTVKTGVDEYTTVGQIIPMLPRKEPIGVVFITNQSTGRNCEPFLTIEHMYICDSCRNEIISGKQLFGSGANGFYHYWFKRPLTIDKTYAIV